MKHLSRFVLYVVFLMFLTACAAPQDELQDYEFAVIRYEKALRWQDLDLLIAFHKNERNSVTAEQRKHLKQFRVTAYNVVQKSMAPDHLHATQVVEVKYYNTDYQIVRDMTLHNDWEYDEKNRQWYLTNPLPVFK